MRSLPFALVVILAGCAFPGGETFECTPGASRPCYHGSPGTRDQGSCRSGLDFCTPEGRWSDVCREATLPASESCNGLDDDCDGHVDEGLDGDGDGTLSCATSQQPVVDCDDQNGQSAPSLEEACDGFDNDCDGRIDEAFDEDSDGFTVCAHRGQPRADCDDGDAQVNPAAVEPCNTRDDDCDGRVDEGTACVGKGVETIAGEAGPLAVLTELHRVSPSLIAHRAGGALQQCNADEEVEACADRWLRHNSRALGLADAAQDLAPDGVTVEGADTPYPIHHVHRAQQVSTRRWGAVRYEGRGVSVHLDSGAVRTISADIGLPPLDRDDPRIPSGEAVRALPDQAQVVGEPTFIAWLVPINGRLPPVEQQTPGFYWRVDYVEANGALGSLYVDAFTGTVALNERHHDEERDILIRDGSNGRTADNTYRPADPLVTPLDLAWSVAGDYYAYLALRLGLDSFDNRGARLEATIEVPSVNMADTPCGQCGCNGVLCLGGCNSGGVIQICAGELDRDTLVHEFNHSLTSSRMRDGRNSGLVETEAVEHAIVEVLAELHGCWAQSGRLPGAACDWNHSGRDYSRLATLDDHFDASSSGLDNRLVPGHALYLFGQHLGRARYMMLEWLLDSAMAHHLRRAATLRDFAGALVVTCRTSSRLALLGVDVGDCIALQQSFMTVGVLPAGCGNVPGTPEVCDGVDNDCDGFVDNAPGVAADDTLTRSCFDGEGARRGVGTCRDGAARCVAGTWGRCIGATLPAPMDPCGGGDQDCDFQTDEDGEIEFMFDRDRDGFGGDAPHILICPADAQAGWVRANGGPLDCDDVNPAVSPGAPERCGDLADDDCDSNVDEGCGCNPAALPRLCGPTRCGGALWGTPGCELPDTGAWCRAGQQRCEWDPRQAIFAWSNLCIGADWGGAEICDGLDNDCDGIVDNPVVVDRGLSVQCGPFGAGREICEDTEVICVDDQRRRLRINACGGQTPLAEKPGDPCPGGDRWICESPESLACLAGADIFASARVIANEGDPWVSSGNNIASVSYLRGIYTLTFTRQPPDPRYIVLTTLANPRRNADNVVVVTGTARNGFTVVTIDASTSDNHSNGEDFNVVVFIP